MDYSLSISDFLVVLKKNIKLVVIVSIVFALLFGGYKIIHDKRNNSNINADVKEQAKVFQEWKDKRTQASTEMNKTLVEAYNVINTHPLMQLDFNNCTVRGIVFSFDEGTELSRASLVKGWLRETKTENLFGKKTETIEKFKSSILVIESNENEITISIFDSKEYDFNYVIDRVAKIVKEESKKHNINITDVSDYTMKGFSQALFDTQNSLFNNAVALQNELGYIKNDVIDEPVGSGNVGGINIFNVTIFFGIGLMIGILFSIMIILIKVLRKGSIISEKQVEAFFNINSVGLIRKHSENEFNLIDAVVRALTNKNDKIMIISSKNDDVYSSIANRMNEISDIEYTYSTTSLDSVEIVEKIKDIDNVIVPVTIGKTSNSEIMDVIKWSNKFKIDVLGYIAIE